MFVTRFSKQFSKQCRLNGNRLFSGHNSTIQLSRFSFKDGTIISLAFPTPKKLLHRRPPVKNSEKNWVLEISEGTLCATSTTYPDREILDVIVQSGHTAHGTHTMYRPRIVYDDDGTIFDKTESIKDSDIPHWSHDEKAVHLDCIRDGYQQQDHNPLRIEHPGSFQLTRGWQDVPIGEHIRIEFNTAPRTLPERPKFENSLTATKNGKEWALIKRECNGPDDYCATDLEWIATSDDYPDMEIFAATYGKADGSIYRYRPGIAYNMSDGTRIAYSVSEKDIPEIGSFKNLHECEIINIY